MDVQQAAFTFWGRADTFPIALLTGGQEWVDGLVGRTVAVHEWKNKWVLTHLPTGYAILGHRACIFQADAIALAEQLDPVLPLTATYDGAALQPAAAVLNAWLLETGQAGEFRYVPKEAPDVP